MGPSRLISFYLGKGKDSEGQTIDEIQAWNHDRLENVHNYIQWLFPLKERSNVNPDAPVLNDEQIAAFRNNQELQARLLKSFELMLTFYGLRCEDEDAGAPIKISKAEDFPLVSRNWMSAGNHNYLRITRILTSLTLLGLETYAQAFFDFLESLYNEQGGCIGRTSFLYWKSAVKR